MYRRDLLAAAGMAGLAGCQFIGESDTGGTDGETPTGDERPSPTPSDAREVHFLTYLAGSPWETLWEGNGSTPAIEQALIPAYEGDRGVDIQLTYPDYAYDEAESQEDRPLPPWDWADLYLGRFDLVSHSYGEEMTPLTGVVDHATGVLGDLVAEPFRDETGDCYQVPYGYYVPTFQYRKDVYDLLDLDVPTSFSGVIDNARTVEKSNLNVRGYGLPGWPEGKAGSEFRAYLAQMGVPPSGLRPVDPELPGEGVEIHFPKRTVVGLLEFFAELAQYSPDPADISWGAALRQWANGRVAQQVHLNMWPAGYAARTGNGQVADSTHVAPLPYWGAGGVGRGDSQLRGVTVHPDAFHVFSGGRHNDAGAKRFVEWLYGETTERAAGTYAPAPTRFLPTFADVLESETYRQFDRWEQHPRFLEEMEYIREGILRDHYGQAAPAHPPRPVTQAVGSRWFYGAMLTRVVTGFSTPEATYDWGRNQLEETLRKVRDQVGN